MSWQIHGEFIKNKSGKIICILFPGVDPFYAMLIKKTPDILTLIMQFIKVFESGRKMTKSLFDGLHAMTEANEDYDFTWYLNQDAEIVDRENRKICFFPDKETTDSILIQYVPEMFFALQQNTPTFESNDTKQKPFYDSVCKLMKKIDEY